MCLSIFLPPAAVGFVRSVCFPVGMRCFASFGFGYVFFHDWLAFLCLRPSLVCSIAALAGSVGFFVGMHVFSTCGAVFVCGVCVFLCRSVCVPVSLY